MKAPNWKTPVPHIIALATFLIVALIFCKPALEGKTLYQHDIVQYEGGSKDIANYAEKHGDAPLWTNGMFSGMPTYQIWMPANNVLPHYVNKILTLGLPQPFQFFFLACVLFYFLSQVARVNPYIGILGALAFGYSTYNPVIIAAGHVTKMWCIAYMPAVLASLMLIYRKKYILGTGLLALFTATQVGLNHLQISYYLFIILAFYTVACIVVWVRNKEYAHLGKSLGLAVVAAILGIMVNAITLTTTYEYSKETIRGGSLSLKDSASTKGTGLTKDYAFSYSYKPLEAFTIMFPRIFGGSDGIRETGDESKVGEAMGEIPPQLAQQLPNDILNRLNGLQSSYWGGLDGTSGPPYFGAIICFLFIVFCFMIKSETKWWILAATIFTFLISWGKYFSGFNDILFDILPFYNKFRAPSVSIVMLELLWPFAAIIALQHIITKREDPDTWKRLKQAGIATAVLFLIMFMAYLSLTYIDEPTKQFKTELASQPPQVSEPLINVINASAKDKKAVFMQDIFKGLAIIGIFYVILTLYVRRKINKASWVIGAGIFLLLVDLLPVGSTYMTKRANGEDAFTDADTEVRMGKADQQIIQDKSWYRVLNLAVSPFQDASTSYFHKSIGGYHAAKIGRYQDLVENKLYQEINLLSRDSTLGFGLNQSKYTGLNMLNTRYIIGSNPSVTSNEQPFVIVNRNALGPAWFVREVRFAPDLKSEMNGLNGLDASQVAIVPASEKSKVIVPAPDSSAKIEWISNDNNSTVYKTTANSPQFAVFSEVYYSAGWNAYVDGKKSDYVRTNYTLRGMSIPAGAHTIEFKFEPASVKSGRQITMIGQILVLLLLAAGVFLEIRKKQTIARN
ncbi:MAG: YfhO family protein [Chitinophagaceae bacterium]|nr:YfhO family protein [Chitinophagaceae bacterium]